ncbi:hypothetical protein PRIPAC_72591 [Pristionchus pacificus]|uniref:Uncharacterized protein n=1 Tax=Pristionchus pacificus TaxID=54126 RepID=A0A2A6BFT9_PRIPA|nr:hypothetical protein PRIPAC_72591 [Pristionchus pacificus]|eukprot:PDM64749.1 hypothetical protein PRIPAC_53005 [Pristionchus pacificus]
MSSPRENMKLNCHTSPEGGSSLLSSTRISWWEFPIPIDAYPPLTHTKNSSAGPIAVKLLAYEKSVPCRVVFQHVLLKNFCNGGGWSDDERSKITDISLPTLPTQLVFFRRLAICKGSSQCQDENYVSSFLIRFPRVEMTVAHVE